MPLITNTTIAIYAPDTAILFATNEPDETSNLLQIYLDLISN